MKWTSIFLLSLSLLGCASNRKENEERASLHLQIGTGFLSKGQYPQAMTELLKAEKLDPANPYILNNLGIAYYLRGRLPVAEQKFRAALKLEPKFSDAKVNLSRVFIDGKRFDEALRLLEQVEADLTYGAPEKALGNMGIIYFEKGQLVKAEDYLARSLAVRRESCTTGYYYGRTLLDLKRPRESADALDKAVEFCRPTQFEAPLYYSAMSYFTLGDKERARARANELIKDYPQSQFVAEAKGMLELLEQ